MITLDEKKKQIFEFLDGKFWENPDHGEWIESLNLFEWFSDSSKDCYILSTMGDWGIKPWIQGGGSIGRTLIPFSKVQQFIQKTLLRDTYIQVKNNDESKWIQELALSVGFAWSYSGAVVKNVGMGPLYLDGNTKFYLTSGDKYYQIDIPYLEKLFNTKFNKKTTKPDQKSLSDQVRKLESELINIQNENRELKQILEDIKARIN